LHSSAFGLFLISVVIGYTSYTIYALNPEGPRAENQYNYVLIGWYLISAIAQLLLCVILWELGSKPDDQSENENVYSSIVIEDFDDQAEVQARIWNKYMREPLIARSSNRDSN
jgi:hypothetical protein